MPFLIDSFHRELFSLYLSRSGKLIPFLNEETLNEGRRESRQRMKKAQLPSRRLPAALQSTLKAYAEYGILWLQLSSFFSSFGNGRKIKTQFFDRPRKKWLFVPERSFADVRALAVGLTQRAHLAGIPKVGMQFASEIESRLFTSSCTPGLWNFYVRMAAKNAKKLSQRRRRPIETCKTFQSRASRKFGQFFANLKQIYRISCKIPT